MVAFKAKFQIPVARQWGRERSAPKPIETDPLHPLGSICDIKQLPYICMILPVISFMWDAQVWIYDNCACGLTETLKWRFKAIFKNAIFPRVHADAFWRDICAIIECVEANLKILK